MGTEKTKATCRQPSRPWRIERLNEDTGEWIRLSTVATQDKALLDRDWYRHTEAGTIRARNRITGEVIE